MTARTSWCFATMGGEGGSRSHKIGGRFDLDPRSGNLKTVPLKKLTKVRLFALLLLTRHAGVTPSGIAVDPYDSNHLLTSNTSPVYESKDGGASWTSLAGAQGGVLVFDPSTPGRVYDSSSGKVERSVDGGKTWVPCLYRTPQGTRQHLRHRSWRQHPLLRRPQRRSVDVYQRPAAAS